MRNLAWLVLPLLWSGCILRGELGSTADGDDDDDVAGDDDDDLPFKPGSCDVPPDPEDWDYIEFDYPGEEFAFDENGLLVTVVDWASSMVTLSYDGDQDIVAPFVSEEVAGVDFLLDGDLVVADEANGALIRLGAAGGDVPIIGGIASPNSVVVDDRGFIYVTAFDQLMRVDPDSGTNVVLDAFPGHDLDGLTFTDDFRYLWVNSDEIGEVYRLELDDDRDLVASEFMADFPLGWDAELDGMAADVCGNLYALRTDGRVHRLRADGTEDHSWVNITGSQWTTSLHFGSGIGGWERDHLYVMDRYGGIYDIDVGLMGVPEPHLR